MKVAIVGSGPIGLGCAALLSTRGHTPFVWSPRSGETSLQAEFRVSTVGLLETAVTVRRASSAVELRDADVVIFCVLGNGHKSVMDAIAPHLESRQTIVISSHCSLGAIYLSRLLGLRGASPTILALATTITGGPMRDGKVHVRLLRNEIDVAAMPVSALKAGLTLLGNLFGDLFVESPDVMAISLSNLNPQIHLANAMLNFTRIERAERWNNFGCITEGVGRLIEALDDERLALAAAFDVRVRTVREHYLKSFSGLDAGRTVHEMAQIVDQQRAGSSPGPTSIESRYITEDLPFGIYANVAIGRVAGIPMPLHEAGLELFSAIYGRDFRTENDLLPTLGLDAITAGELHHRCRYGWGTSLPCKANM
ncbi:Opine dehydrogenase [Paraburkholderia piptadeniae]|uniref:2-dehydropantoate 2-reductase n=1 Tax=Paraburkholderia piptadeniae TaxID=1701573 RepID=A0A1N7SPM3_9BURK|nr:NAD/NADP octopine/nopaline dehydrogenase family protein [Paraburkholderia piptadeniae]SIT49384.1 Opine dehydrogenase [Paraburkholderia piptadeniae]